MGYQVNLITNLEINTENCNFKGITISFLFSLKGLFQEYVKLILLHYFEEYYKNGKLAKKLGVETVKKKTANKLTKFKTLFENIEVPQIQVRVIGLDGIERQMSITRILLGVSRKYQIPDFMKELLGWIESVCTYRLGHKITGMLTNFKCSLMSVWNSVQWYGKQIKLKLSTEETNEFEADGTGIPTHKTGKRGSELKKVFQRDKDGKLHLVGLTIGKYKSLDDWLSILSNPIKEGLKQFGKIIPASDGDKSIIDTAMSIDKKRVKIQKDIWHVFHQLKYYLWQDKVPKEIRSNIIKLVYKITMILTCFSSQKRLHILSIVINNLKNNSYNHTAVYLQSAMRGFYTYETEGNSNIYTTRTERSQRKYC
jgi:hypothetical protein